MKCFSTLGLSWLIASTLATGCSEQSSQLELSSNVAAQVKALYENGPLGNGGVLNGSKLNGSKLNGSKLNGEIVQTIQNITASAGTLIGIILETNAVLSGPGFAPTSLIAELDDNTVAPVKVIDYQLIPATANTPAMDTYLVVNPATGDSICGLDETGHKVYATPMLRTFNQLTGAPVARVGLFTFACRYAALQKCNEYGYPDWSAKNETYLGVTKTRQLDNHHDSCVRLVRADYCGDGQAHTVTGTVVDIYDNLGINVKETSTDGSDSWYFEADWSIDGAWCINKTRWMGNTTTPTLAHNNNSAYNVDWAYLESHCPERIAGRAWPGNPLGNNAPRTCGTSSNYNASAGFNMADQSQRSLLRSNSKIYQH